MLVDLSHRIEPGMTTYKGLPGPIVCDYWTREESAAHYEDGSTFQIGRIDMVANTGTYLDSPFHRYADGVDLAGLTLESVAAIDAIMVPAPWEKGLAVDSERVAELDVEGKAVLIATGWDRHWRTDSYFENHPFVTAAAARALAKRGATLVGIDSHNIDDTRTRARPVHSILLGAGIPICEHLRSLDRLPERGFRFSAVPPKFAGVGTFPVRAFAEIPDTAG